MMKITKSMEFSLQPNLVTELSQAICVDSTKATKLHGAALVQRRGSACKLHGELSKVGHF
jgi:hypothetical protein